MSVNRYTKVGTLVEHEKVEGLCIVIRNHGDVIDVVDPEGKEHKCLKSSGARITDHNDPRRAS